MPSTGLSDSLELVAILPDLEVMSSFLSKECLEGDALPGLFKTN